MEPSFAPKQLSLTVPRHPHLNLHLHLTFLVNCSMVHLTTSTVGESHNSSPPLGSFVYAMPDVRMKHKVHGVKLLLVPKHFHRINSGMQRLNQRNAISTALTTSNESIDYATRLAKILARRTKSPAYVGCSMNFAGITADEEIEGLALVVDHIMHQWEKRPR